MNKYEDSRSPFLRPLVGLNWPDLPPLTKNSEETEDIQGPEIVTSFFFLFKNQNKGHNGTGESKRNKRHKFTPFLFGYGTSQILTINFKYFNLVWYIFISHKKLQLLEYCTIYIYI